MVYCALQSSCWRREQFARQLRPGLTSHSGWYVSPAGGVAIARLTLAVCSNDCRRRAPLLPDLSPEAKAPDHLAFSRPATTGFGLCCWSSMFDVPLDDFGMLQSARGSESSHLSQSTSGEMAGQPGGEQLEIRSFMSAAQGGGSLVNHDGVCFPPIPMSEMDELTWCPVVCPSAHCHSSTISTDSRSITARVSFAVGGDFRAEAPNTSRPRRSAAAHLPSRLTRTTDCSWCRSGDPAGSNTNNGCSGETACPLNGPSIRSGRTILTHAPDMAFTATPPSVGTRGLFAPCPKASAWTSTTETLR